MQCPRCGVLARLRRKTELGEGRVQRIYRCEQLPCGYRFTSIEEVAGPTAWGGSRSIKITPEDVAEIKALLSLQVLSHAEIAAFYQVSRPLITRIAIGDLWRAVRPIPLDRLPPEQAALLARDRVSRVKLIAEPFRPVLSDLSARGCTLSEMSRILAEQGHCTRTGRPLSRSTIRGWLEALELDPRPTVKH